jgi:hypothetical protein
MFNWVYILLIVESCFLTGAFIIKLLRKTMDRDLIILTVVGLPVLWLTALQIPQKQPACYLFEFIALAFIAYRLWRMNTNKASR